MRYLGVVQYKGTNYCGWQSQTVSKLPAIQTEIEKVLSKLLNQEIKIYGSGRTDAGVHALGQTFHFDVDKEIDSFRFIHGFNELISNDIVLTKLDKVDDNFHARFSATKKTYIYKIECSKNSSPFNEHLMLQLHQNLDVEKMKEASKIFIGEHNFMNFTSKEEDEQNFVRFIETISISQSENIIEISMTGNGFMRYMVRMIVGTLIEVGLGKISAQEVEQNLNNKTRKPSSFKASADGLYLKEVLY